MHKKGREHMKLNPTYLVVYYYYQTNDIVVQHFLQKDKDRKISSNLGEPLEMTDRKPSFRHVCCSARILLDVRSSNIVDTNQEPLPAQQCT